MLPEVRMALVLDAISSHRAGRLICVEAGELLGFRPSFVTPKATLSSWLSRRTLSGNLSDKHDLQAQTQPGLVSRKVCGRAG